MVHEPGEGHCVVEDDHDDMGVNVSAEFSFHGGQS